MRQRREHQVSPRGSAPRAPAPQCTTGQVTSGGMTDPSTLRFLIGMDSKYSAYTAESRRVFREAQAIKSDRVHSGETGIYRARRRSVRLTGMIACCAQR